MTDASALYAGHLEAALAATREALAHADAAGASFSGVVFHAGPETRYHADDAEIPFRQVPHFARFGPVPGHDHLLLVPREGDPRLIRVEVRDFWVEPTAPPPFSLSPLASETVATPRAARERAGSLAGWAYVGNDPTTAEALGATCEPAPLVAALDWLRGFKTPYEVGCLREAARIAGLGHAAVRDGVAAGLSERALHFAYLDATGHLGHETPYGSIIAWDEASAILHYTAKRATPPDPGATFLIDAGGSFLGYASDITRTYTRDGVHPVFQECLDRLHDLQDALVEGVEPGASYIDLHVDTMRGVAAILSEVEVLTVSPSDAMERNLVFPFLPHGLGHHLGLQVHDVGGKLGGPDGELVPPPERYPWLRTTRPLAAGHVVTIEPGLYFIPLLLDPHRSGPDAEAFNWDLIDALIPNGGIRIEDDVLCTADGRENLSRPFVPTRA